MKPFQCRIFVVRVNGSMGNAVVFQVLHKVYGKETFAHATFAVDDGVEFLLHKLDVLADG
jgi:hypothetical protein